LKELFLFIDLFDTIGTLIGVASKANARNIGNIIYFKILFAVKKNGADCYLQLGTILFK